MKIAGLIGSLLLATGISSCNVGVHIGNDSRNRIQTLYAQYPEILSLQEGEAELKNTSAFQMYSDPDVRSRYVSLTKQLDSANRIVTEAFNQSKYEYKRNQFGCNLILAGFLTAWAGPFCWAYALDRRNRKKQTL